MSYPVFIVGLPRSGTQLLRDLLNRHSHISLPIEETQFLPYLFKRYSNEFLFYKEIDLSKIFSFIRKTNFYQLMRNHNKQLDFSYFKDACKGMNIAEIFKFVSIYYSEKKAPIWGDKTPNYLSRIKDISTLYPEAKFLHIIRDPRDVIVSNKKLFGATYDYSAELWRRNIISAKKNMVNIKENYIEIKYEDLLSNPLNVLTNICNFLNCKFEYKMLTLEKPADWAGDTKENTSIVKTNFNKYKKILSNREIERNEMITFPLLKEFKYEIEYANKFKPLNVFYYSVLKLLNFFIINYHLSKNKGIKSVLYDLFFLKIKI